LTPGEGEVEYVGLAADRRSVLYAGNHGDLHRRHLHKVSAGGGTPSTLTRGSGIEWMAVESGDGKALAYLRSDAKRPAHAAVEVNGAPARELTPLLGPPVDGEMKGKTASSVELPLVEPQAVTFAAADGRTIHGQLFLPRSLQPGERRPGVLFFHGGSHRQMLLGWHYLAYYHNAYALNQYLASRGFVVLSVNFRSGTGYGLNFREAPAQGAAGASEFNDVLGAGLYLRARPEVDPVRLGLWGGSYGGYLTALGLARASDLFAAGVDIHGVHDWNVGIRTFVPDYKPTPEQERLAFESSPLAAVDRWRSPVLLIHGDDDRNVSFSETVTLVEKLRERGVEHELLVLPDEIHSFLRYESWLRAFRAAAEFFERTLAARPSQPSPQPLPLRTPT
jgi:dipeptidyl aminopeptidase/acylaminoacyl peptidase